MKLKNIGIIVLILGFLFAIAYFVRTNSTAAIQYDTTTAFTSSIQKTSEGKFEWQGGAPAVANVKGQPWDFEMDGYIGNGSTGLVRVAVYPAGNSGRTGSRLESVQVVDHVEFESEGGSLLPS